MISRLLKRLRPRPSGSRRLPSKRAALETLKGLGVPVETVIDVGVQEGTPALAEVFPDRFHLLVEPIEEWNPSIKRFYDTCSIRHEVVNAAAAQDSGEVTLRTKSVLAGLTPSHAFIVGGPPAEPADRRVRMTTVDRLIEERSHEGPYLLKIDVDGAELSVLAGARQTLTNTSIVVMEVGVTNMLDRMSKMRQAGFELADIVDLCYYGDRFIQADAIFLNSKTLKDLKLEFYREGFDPSLWNELSI